MRYASLTVLYLLILVTGLQAQYHRVPLEIGRNGTTGTVHLFVFDSRRVAMKIIDQGSMKKPTYRDLGEAMTKNRCIAGCNGGSFGPTGQPLGLVIANGTTSGTRKIGSSLTSGVLRIDGTSPRLQQSERFFEQNTEHPLHLLQAGPFLVEGSQVVEGLSTRRVTRRTFVLTDGKHLWAIGHTPPTSLAHLAAALANPKSFKEFKVAAALNLAGGSSSGIWIDRKHSPLYLKEGKPVRNFVGLVRR